MKQGILHFSRYSFTLPYVSLSLCTVVVLLLPNVVTSYHRYPCTRQAAADFSFDDCYLPQMNADLALSEASFVMSHDAATGYMQRSQLLRADGITWSYTQTQTGDLYQQLQDGARALDLRPKLWQNGTVVFHHGIITVPVSFEMALQDVIRWCNENPTEIVLLLTSHYTFGRVPQGGSGSVATTNDDDNEGDNPENYQNDDQYDQSSDNAAMVTALQKIYNQYGVLYVSCADVYGWTVETVQEQAALETGGILLALDGKDVYPGTSCAKENWVEAQVVPCWWTNRTSCKTSNVPYEEKLKDYILQSANNDPTDNSNQLGPPSNLYRYPLNEIQALWQVTGQSAVIGLAHLSNIIADDTASKLHVNLVELIHGENMPGSISLLAVDNVALHGNALLSVLRNRCGQSILTNVPCGPDLAPPRLQYWHMETRVVVAILLSLYIVTVMIIFFRKRPHLLREIGDATISHWSNWQGKTEMGEAKREALILQKPEATMT